MPASLVFVENCSRSILHYTFAKTTIIRPKCPPGSLQESRHDSKTDTARRFDPVAPGLEPRQGRRNSGIGGTRELVISYHAQAANRPAFRAYLLKQETARLAALKRNGVLAHYQILFNPFVTPRTWTPCCC